MRWIQLHRRLLIQLQLVRGVEVELSRTIKTPLVSEHLWIYLKSMIYLHRFMAQKRQPQFKRRRFRYQWMSRNKPSNLMPACIPSIIMIILLSHRNSHQTSMRLITGQIGQPQVMIVLKWMRSIFRELLQRQSAIKLFIKASIANYYKISLLVRYRVIIK